MWRQPNEVPKGPGGHGAQPGIQNIGIRNNGIQNSEFMNPWRQRGSVSSEGDGNKDSFSQTSFFDLRWGLAAQPGLPGMQDRKPPFPQDIRTNDAQSFTAEPRSRMLDDSSFGMYSSGSLVRENFLPPGGRVMNEGSLFQPGANYAAPPRDTQAWALQSGIQNGSRENELFLDLLARKGEISQNDIERAFEAASSLYKKSREASEAAESALSTVMEFQTDDALSNELTMNLKIAVAAAKYSCQTMQKVMEAAELAMKDAEKSAAMGSNAGGSTTTGSKSLLGSSEGSLNRTVGSRLTDDKPSRDMSSPGHHRTNHNNNILVLDTTNRPAPLMNPVQRFGNVGGPLPVPMLSPAMAHAAAQPGPMNITLPGGVMPLPLNAKGAEVKRMTTGPEVQKESKAPPSGVPAHTTDRPRELEAGATAEKSGKKTVSKSCHACGHIPLKRGSAVCANFEAGSCRKIVCEKCLTRHMGDKAQDYLSGRENFVCFHCKGTCPSWAQCTYYKRANARRKQG